MAIIDRVKFDGPPDVLVWKWPSDALSIGSQLIVNESQEALFFKSGQALDLFGPGTHTLTTGNLPFLRKLINLPFGGQTPFSAEVYFVSKSVALAQDWGTKTPFMVLDPKYRVSVPLRAYGQYGLRVVNSREFIVQIAGASGGGTRGSLGADAASRVFSAQVAGIPNGSASTLANDTARNLLEALIITCVQQAVGDQLAKGQTSVLEVPSNILAVGQRTRDLLASNYQTFGVEFVNFALESVNFDPNDESVKQLRSMLNEAARLDYVGEAFRRNQDFYRSERQFDVLQDAAGNAGGAGGVMGAAMGIGMGFGVAGNAGQIARDSMAPAPAPAGNPCQKCGAALHDGARFCNTCGEPAASKTRPCPKCGAANDVNARFCQNCGEALAERKCAKCGAQLPANARFCGDCGQQA